MEEKLIVDDDDKKSIINSYNRRLHALQTSKQHSELYLTTLRILLSSSNNNAHIL